MKLIDQIIERELLAWRDVSIPFVGTLRMIRHGARILPDDPSLCYAPMGELSLVVDFNESRSLVALIAYELCADDMDLAADIYNGWIAQCSAGGFLDIDSVCRINLADFSITLYDSFAELSNVTRGQAVAVGRSRGLSLSGQGSRGKLRVGGGAAAKRKGGNVGLTVSLLVVLAAGLYMLYYLFFRQPLA